MVVPRLVFQAGSTFGAQALAVFPAHRLERQHCYNCVPQHRFKIDKIVINAILLFFAFLRLGHIALVEEKFLYINLKVVAKGIQASATFANNVDGSGSRYQNSFVYGLKPQGELDIRAFLNTNQRDTKITRRSNVLFKNSHATRTASKVLDINYQGRTCIPFNENSC